MLVALARASVTPTRMPFSCVAAPLATAARLGMRLARSWNAACTSAHRALAFSCSVGTELTPQPDRLAAAAATRTKRWVRLNTGCARSDDIGEFPSLAAEGRPPRCKIAMVRAGASHGRRNRRVNNQLHHLEGCAKFRRDSTGARRWR